MARSCSIASAPTRDDGTSLAPDARRSASICVGRGLRGAGRDRATGQGLAKPDCQLVAIELLADAVALDDDEPGGFDPLVRGEPHRTGRALAAAADGGGVIEVSRVDDPGLPLAALGAAHRSPVLPDHYMVWCAARIPLHGVVRWRPGAVRHRPQAPRRRMSCGSFGAATRSLGSSGMPGDRVAGVEEVQVAPFEGRLALEFAVAASDVIMIVVPCSTIDSARPARSRSAMSSERIERPWVGGLQVASPRRRTVRPHRWPP